MLDTGRVPVGPLVSVPFTLVGTIHACMATVPQFPPNACRFEADRVHLSIVGSGNVRAIFSEVPDSNLVQIEQIWYEVQPIPEPTTLLLVAAGVATLGAVARRRRARRA